jgi:hypothetical protein
MAHTYIHTYVRTYVRTYIHTYIHALHNHRLFGGMGMMAHTYIHTYVHTYIHTYIHTSHEHRLFGGMGMMALPIDLIGAWYNRPRPIDLKQFAEKKLALKKRCEELIQVPEACL